MPPQTPSSARERLLLAVATGFGSGRSPVAPGTAGSAVGVLLAWPLLALPLPAYLGVAALVAALGVVAAGAAERHLGAKDPGAIVIDEIAGMLLTLTGTTPGVGSFVLGFLLFRLFDIVKPFPCRWAERNFSGGFGVMADDLMAGVYACACLHLLGPLLERGRELLG